VDDEWEGTEEFLKTGYPLVANFSTLPAFLRENVVDEVVIDLPIESLHDEIRQIIAQCVEQGVVVRFISYNYLFLRKVPAQAKIDLFEDTILVSLRSGAMGEWPLLMKSVFDFMLALLLLAVLSPLLLLIALANKFTSPGPVFFIQERVGLHKRRFRMYKFRTMVSGAEQRQAELEAMNEASGPMFKLKNDPRVTPIGRFLRKTSMDELPQLVNVLKGDMSLVGPRPLPVGDYNGFNTDWHRRRFSVRPGITCLWQVSNCHFHVDNLRRRFPSLERQRFYVVYGGLDLRDGPWSKYVTPGADLPLRILHIGRLAPVKAQEVLIRALARVRDQGRDFRCRVVGDGPQREELQGLITSLNLQDRVQLLGERFADEVARLHEWSQVLVLSSRSEGTPMVIMEAMAKARPVIAPRITAIPEMVAHGRTGYLYAPGDVEDLAARLAGLADLPEAVIPLGREGRTRAEALFDLARNARELMAVFARELPWVQEIPGVTAP
jgi:lipopolysaccharide/colanic/teichoic acid biosynthesis glycosyltransferase